MYIEFSDIRAGTRRRTATKPEQFKKNNSIKIT